MLLDWVSYTFVFLEIVYLAHYSQSSLLTWKQFDLFWSCFENLFSKMRATFNRGLIWLPKWVKSLLRILTMHLELGGFQSSWWEQALFLVLGETSIGYPILVSLIMSGIFIPGPWLSPHIQSTNEYLSVCWRWALHSSLGLPLFEAIFSWVLFPLTLVILVFLDFQLFSLPRESANLLCYLSLYRSLEILSRQ